jgi:hypothetical protein
VQCRTGEREIAAWVEAVGPPSVTLGGLLTVKNVEGYGYRRTKRRGQWRP